MGPGPVTGGRSQARGARLVSIWHPQRISLYFFLQCREPSSSTATVLPHTTRGAPRY